MGNWGCEVIPNSKGSMTRHCVGAAILAAAISAGMLQSVHAGPVVKGAAVGAAGGAVVGAISGGDALKGAAVGAAAGAVVGAISK